MDIYGFFASMLNCYESDLRVNRLLIWREADIASIPDERFSLAEWNAFLRYVLTESPVFSSVSEAKRYLIEKKCLRDAQLSG